MKKVSGLLWGIFAIFIVHSLSAASPSLHGRPGGVRVHSASPITNGDISLSYAGEYLYQNDVFLNTEKTKTSGDIYFSASPLNSLLLFFGKRSNDIKSTSGLLEQTSSNSYYESGLFSTIALSQSARLGFEAAGGSFLADQVKFLRTIDTSFKTIFSFEMMPHFFLHTNLSYHYNQTAKVIRHILYSNNVSQTIIFPKQVYHVVVPALGFEYQTKYLDFVAEYTLEYLLRSGLKPFEHPNYVTLGLKWKPSVKVPIQLMAGVDIGLNRADYLIQGWKSTFDYNVFGGISFGWSGAQEKTDFDSKPTLEVAHNDRIQETAETAPSTSAHDIKESQNPKFQKDPLLLRFRKPDRSKDLLLKFRN